MIPITWADVKVPSENLDAVALPRQGTYTVECTLHVDTRAWRRVVRALRPAPVTADITFVGFPLFRRGDCVEVATDNGVVARYCVEGVDGHVAHVRTWTWRDTVRQWWHRLAWWVR